MQQYFGWWWLDFEVSFVVPSCGYFMLDGLVLLFAALAVDVVGIYFDDPFHALDTLSLTDFSLPYETIPR